jgi:CMP-N-acetylneuraminic acid synthetase
MKFKSRRLKILHLIHLLEQKAVWFFMKHFPSILGIITARGGSKTVPLKNIHPLGEKPLLAWAYEAAQRATSISRLICSTDHQKIAEYCEGIGLEVHHRSAELAQDDTPTYPVIEQLLLDLCDRETYEPDAVFIIQPTSPFVTEEQFDAAAAMLYADDNFASVQSIVEVPHHYHAYNQRYLSNNEIRFVYEHEHTVFYNKQLKPKHYALGNIFLIRTKALLEQKTVFAVPTGGFEVPAFSSMDIDTFDDFAMAEAFIKSGKQ